MLDVRSDFPIFKNNPKLIYLDSAATSQKPYQVIEALKNFYEHYNANVHRAIYSIGEKATRSYEDARRTVARFINARSEREIVFTRNATEAINLVAYAWARRKLKEGDEIVITLSEHHANLVPWQQIAKERGFKLSYIDVDHEGKLVLEDARRKITSRTRMVALNHASNVTGIIHPVKEIVELARKVGALVLLDACQSVPHLRVDVQDLGVDFVAFSGHKMLAPMGIGVLWAREEILEDMEPFLYGGDMIETVELYESTWNELPYKFEAGTPNVEGAIGLKHAIDYLEGLGMDRVFEHERKILEYAMDRILSIDALKLYGSKDTESRLAIFTFNFEGLHAHDVAHFLDNFGIAVRSGHHCAQPLLRKLGALSTVRASFYIYNDLSDVDALVDALKEVAKYVQSV